MGKQIILAVLTGFLGFLSIAAIRPPLFNPGIPGKPKGGITDISVCAIRYWLCVDRRGGRRGRTPSRPSPPPAPVCNETPTGPSIYGFSYDPDYPIVVGQDPRTQGFEFRVRARGGQDECGDPIRLTSLEVDITLSPDSVNWILTDLAKRYPGARPLGYAIQDRKVTLNGSEGNVRMHVLPYDPGVYLIQITARQSNGMTAVRTFRVPVYLLEGTLIEP